MGLPLKNLKSLRKSSRMTQEKLAKAMNVSQTSIGSWELGSREPSCEDLIRLADYFNVSLDYLMGRNDDRQCRSLSSEDEKILSVFKRLDKDNKKIISDTMAAFLTQQAARLFGNVINNNGGEVRNCFNSGNNCVMS